MKKTIETELDGKESSFEHKLKLRIVNLWYSRHLQFPRKSSTIQFIDMNILGTMDEGTPSRFPDGPFFCKNFSETISESIITTDTKKINNQLNVISENLKKIKNNSQKSIDD